MRTPPELDDIFIKEVSVKMIKDKFRIKEASALNIMKTDCLFAYETKKGIMCPREYFDQYVNMLIDVGHVPNTSEYNARTDHSELKNTLEPVMTKKDFQEKFGFETPGAAKKLMLYNGFCSYSPTPKTLVCERQYFKEVYRELLERGGIKELLKKRMSLPYIGYKISDRVLNYPSNFITFADSILSDDEFRRFVNAILKDLDKGN